MARSSALVVLYRRIAKVDPTQPDAIELYLVERSPRLSFFGGHFAFPGGCVDAEDRQFVGAAGGSEAPGTAPGPAAGSASSSGAAERGDDDRVLRACAVRELFEETGVLLAKPATTSARWPTRDRLERLRGALLAGTDRTFASLLADTGLAGRPESLRWLTRLVTPRFSARRYDSTFYLAELEADTGGEPNVIEGELTSGRWVRPGAAVAAWRSGELKLAAPIVSLLETFAREPLEDAVRELGRIPPEFAGSGRSIPYAPGYDLIPLRTPPLPASLPTTTLLVGGREFIVVDPGPVREAETRHLLEAIDRRLERGDRCLSVVLTHHHRDHVGALNEVVKRYEVPVWGHRRTAERLERPLERELADGDVIDLGTGPDGRGDWTLRVLFTPGHADGHIVLHDERYRSLVAGDLVSTLVSMYVGSPGGDLQQYFASVERVIALDVDVLYPAHGAPSHDVRRLLEGTIRHRRERLEQVRDLLLPEPLSVEEVASKVYPGLGEQMDQMTRRTTRAALQYLAHQGQAREVEADRFVRGD